MNFQNPYLNPYGLGQGVPQAFPAQVMQPKQVEKVNGRNGAMQYPMGPNSQAWILDEGGLMSWLIITDSAGYKTVTPYDVTPHEEKPAPDYGSLETRIKRLEEKINGYPENTAAAGRRIPDSGAGEANDPYHAKRRPAGGAGADFADEPEYETGGGNSRPVRRRPDESLPGDR